MIFCGHAGWCTKFTARTVRETMSERLEEPLNALECLLAQNAFDIWEQFCVSVLTVIRIHLYMKGLLYWLIILWSFPVI